MENKAEHRFQRSSQSVKNGGDQPSRSEAPSTEVEVVTPTGNCGIPTTCRGSKSRGCRGSGSHCSQKRAPQPVGPSHPLNQLDEDEIRESSSIIKSYAVSQGIQEELLFASISLKEPPKDVLMPYLWEKGPKPSRQSWAVVSPSGINTVYEITVNLDTKQVDIFSQLAAGFQPSLNSQDPLTVQDIVRKDPRIIERAHKLGITNMELVMCDTWSVGHNDTAEDQLNLRLISSYIYKSNYVGDNQYAHPLDFFAKINLITKEVVEIIDLPVCSTSQPPDTERPVPPPEASHNFDPRVLPPDFFRKDVKPIEITQVDGPSFEIVGNTIKWQRWEMIVGFNFREGLTLHNISFDDRGTKRKVLYRATLSEMVVPYGDPRYPYNRKSAFDGGEDGIGYNSNSLTNGCDCLGEIRYMDFVYSNSKGEPEVTENAICIHEEDAGLLQKHTEWRNDSRTIARSRKLVVSFIPTVTNYDYLFYWNFYQDGTIEMDVKASGLSSTHMLGAGPECESGKYGTLVAPRLIAPYHQHIFYVRLDPMIDGSNNTVSVQEVIPLQEPVGSEIDPLGVGIITRSTILERAGESGTNTAPDLNRSWIVSNENVLHPHTKQPVGWKLVTPGFSRILAAPDSPITRRAGFAQHNVWVTPYNDEQLYAAGKYINQAPGDRDGVHVWAKRDNGEIRNKDIVLWHTFGMTHVPRAEDFPLMPVEGVSFMFRPSNFFAANPALDVPAPPAKKARVSL